MGTETQPVGQSSTLRERQQARLPCWAAMAALFTTLPTPSNKPVRTSYGCFLLVSLGLRARVVESTCFCMHVQSATEQQPLLT